MTLDRTPAPAPSELSWADLPLYLSRWELCALIFRSESTARQHWNQLSGIHYDELCSYMPRYEAYTVPDGTSRARDVNAAYRAAFVSRIMDGR